MEHGTLQTTIQVLPLASIDKKANERKTPSQTLIKRSRRTQVPRLLFAKIPKEKQRKSYFDLKFASRNKKKRKNKEKRKKTFFVQSRIFVYFYLSDSAKQKTREKKRVFFQRITAKKYFHFLIFVQKASKRMPKKI